MRPIVIVLLGVAAILVGSGASAAKEIPPLPPPSGTIVNVSTADALRNAVLNAAAGQTILIAPGTYNYPTLGWALPVTVSNISIWGSTDNAADVQLVGPGFYSDPRKGEMIVLDNGASNITIANLTIRDVGFNSIKLQSGGNNNILIHNVRMINFGYRGLKGPTVAPSSDGIVQYCHFEQIDELTLDWPADGNYIGGVDAEYFVRWTFRDNVFKNIRGMTKGARGAIYLKRDSSDCIIERNTFVGCDRSISLGNPAETQTPFNVKDSIVRNNFIYSGASQAIEFHFSHNINIYNNSIHHMHNVNNATTIVIQNNSHSLDFRNNIVFSTRERIDEYPEGANLWFTNSSLYSDYFVDVAAGDFHLLPTATLAIGTGSVLPEVTDDWDKEPRSSTPDMGADEIPRPDDNDDAPTLTITAPTGDIERAEGWTIDFACTLTGAGTTVTWVSDLDGQFGTATSFSYADLSFASDSTIHIIIVTAQNDIGNDEKTFTVTLRRDSNGDGIPDYWAAQYGFDPDDPDCGIAGLPAETGGTYFDAYLEGRSPFRGGLTSKGCGPAGANVPVQILMAVLVAMASARRVKIAHLLG